MRIILYTPDEAKRWDEFIATCPMATFLHSRRFLSYHKDRFQDLSLMLFDDENKLLACFPAAQSLSDPTIVVSHPGITFGGVLHQGRLLGTAMIQLMQLIIDYYSTIGYKTLEYKSVPSIYHKLPCADDLYALFLLGAILYRRDLGCVIDLRLPISLPPSEMSKLQNMIKRKAVNKGVQVCHQIGFLEPLWELLANNLEEKYSAKPIHSLEEIKYLLENFPDEIELRVAVLDGKILSGTILFISPTVMHTQYLVVSEAGKSFFALDFLMENCIENARKLGKAYFSFGISTEQNGRYLNQGLYQSKAKHGGAGVTHDFYRVIIRNDE